MLKHAEFWEVNALNRRYKIVLAVTLVVLCLAVSITSAHRHMQYVRQLEQARSYVFAGWAAAQASAALEFDKALAEILVTANTSALPKSIQHALAAAERGNKLLTEQPPQQELALAISEWEDRLFYSAAHSYLVYLDSTLHTAPPDETHLRVISSMRIAAESTYAEFLKAHNKILEHVASSQHSSDILLEALSSISRHLAAVPHPRDEDEHYEAYLLEVEDHVYRYSLGRSGETEHSEPAMRDRAEQFAAQFFGARLRRTVQTPSAGGYSTVSGAYIRFVVADPSTGIDCHIQVSEKGMHILSARIRVPYTPNDTITEILRVAEHLLTCWTQSESVVLTHVMSPKDTVSLYSAVEHGVIMYDKQVTLSLDTEIAEHSSTTAFWVSLDATKYFANFMLPIEQSAWIPSVRARDIIGSAAGEPELTLRDAKLLYRVPVSGVPRVSAAYVNAVSGEYEFMEYVVPR